MRKSTTQSTLLVAGLAAGAAAAAVTWLGRRRPTSVNPNVDQRSDSEPESAKLPLGRSADRGIADRGIDDERSRLPQHQSMGSTFLSEPELPTQVSASEDSLDEIWKSLPDDGIKADQGEGYDAVPPEDLGAVWLERATQTTHEAHEDRMQPIDNGDLTELEQAMVSEATLLSAQPLDESDRDDDAIADDELDLDLDEESEQSPDSLRRPF